MMKFRTSVVILTFNESINISDCIVSAKLISDDIVVLDSFSTDNTVEIAKSMGVKVETNKFIGYATQRNFALQSIKYKYNWIFMIDADERVCEKVKLEIDSLDFTKNTMFKCKRRDFFLGRWLKRSSGYPTWFPRLFKLGSCSVEREINEEYVTVGGVGYLETDIVHFPFNKGVDEWFDKHNRYSSMEAELIYNKKNKIIFKELFSLSLIHI